MDALMVVLRLIHIFAGVFWVGAAMMMVGYIGPAAAASGEAGGGFMRAFYTRTNFASVIGIAAGLTLLSGLIMYWRVSDGFSGDWMRSTGGIVLSIGAVAGILAAGHGGAVLGRRTNEFIAIIKEMESAGGAPSPERMAEMQRLQQYLACHGRITLVILVVALIGMSIARYM